MERIALLVVHEGYRDVLVEHLQRDYALISPDMSGSDAATQAVHEYMFDCCIVDLPGLAQLGDHLLARKHAAAPLPLPLLLVANSHEITQLTHDHRDIVDEIIRTPIDQWVLQKRITTLLRERHLSAMLAQSNTLLNQEITRRKLMQHELAHRDAQVPPPPVPPSDTLSQLTSPNTLTGDPHNLFSQSLDIIIIIDGEHGRILDINPTVYPMLGYTPESLIGQHFSRLFPPLEDESPHTTLNHLRTYGAVFASQEFLRADGSTCPMDITATIIPWGAGKAILTGLRDVTERREAEAAQSQLAAIVQSSSDAIISKSLDGIILSWNAGAEHIYGYTADEVIGQHISLLVPPENSDEVDMLLARICEGERISHYETVRQRKDGRSIYVSLTISPISNPAGVITSASVIARDISQQKQMESALVDSKNRLRHILDFNPIGMVVLDLNGIIRYANPSARRLLNREGLEGEILGYPLANTGKCELDTIPESGKVVTLEIRITEINWDEDHAYIISLLDITERTQAEDALRRLNDELEVRVRDRTHELSQANVFLQKEIEQRKRAEQALIAARARLQHLIITSPVVIFTCTVGGDFGATFVSDNITSIFGYDAHEFTDESNFWASHIHPDDAPRIFNNLPHLFETGYHEHDYRFRHKDGSYRWVYNQLRLVYDEDTAIEIVGSLQDITERKQAEDAVKQARDRLEQRVEERTQMLQYSVQRALREINERERAEAEAHRQARRAEGLLWVASHLNAQLDLETLLNDICQQAVKMLYVSAATVMLYDEQSDLLTIAADAGLPPEYRQQHQPIPCVVYSEYINLQRAVMARPDVRGIPDMAEHDLYMRLDIRSTAICGMLHDSKLIGILSIFTIGETRQFNSDELALLQGLADQAALAIINARQFEALEESKALLEQRVAEATADLRRANEELARAARLKDEFLAGMSHELRTPLNAILGMSEILQEGIYGPLSDKQVRSLQTIEESGRHLLSLINDILDLSKIQAGKIELEIGTVDIETLCQTSLRLVKQTAHKKRIQVFISIDSTITTLQADERRLKQILVNLLSNAVKFTHEGGQIGLEVSKAADALCFAIWDTGIGIAPEDMSRLFKPFVQVDSSLSRNYEGTGLGLALVAELTEMHGGSISIESEVGVGSRFTVLLPTTPIVTEPRNALVTSAEDERITQSLSALLAPQPGNAPAEASTAEQPIVAMRQPTILLAEDNQANIDTLLDYLQSRGYHVIVAHDGIQALEALRQTVPTIILMDIQMPVMDGLETIRRIRADSTLATIPIIALTALTMPGDRERCLEAGANDYMSKPVSLKGLIHAIESQIAML